MSHNCLRNRSMVNRPSHQIRVIVTADTRMYRRIVATANGFLNFLGGYSIFQGPVVGIMIVDYFIVRKGNMDLIDMYSTSSMGRYFYFKGFNLRAYAAFVIGFLLPLPGFAASFGYKISPAASHMYALGWVLSFVMGGVSYFLICLVRKVPGDDGDSGFESRELVDIIAFVDDIYEGEGRSGTMTPENSEKDVKVNSSSVV